ncbi:MAG: GTP pyrophosphokinase [Elusimicrobia bacterium]|nr:MAG: GTP pyrophosphokinase [Elusimicrobiota bacterium]
MSPEAKLAEMLEKVRAYSPHADLAPLEKAYTYSLKAHEHQARASGEHYFVHCSAVAETLIDFKLDLATVCAGLLHDVIEDTPVTREQLAVEFGAEVAALVEGVTKLETIQFVSRDEAQAENWRKMLLATAQDIRVIMIKLADRLHNMKTLNFLDHERQKRIAHETLSLYAPLAHRLGMFRLKSELEDLAFTYLHPAEHAELDAQVKAKKKSFPEIQDAMGVRLITDTVANCYALLGLVHTEFKPVAGSFTDYISVPKLNLYQSLHTTVMSPQGDLIEIQLRTEEMHRTSEFGIAAHWRYKLGAAAPDAHLEEKLNWLRQWIEWLQDLKSPREFLESLKTDLELHQVFVFTPAGEVKVLPARATPLDFAFAVHTDIGMACVGAKVNNKMVKFDYELQSGDICEIVVKKGSLPKKDWLNHVRTARARSKIRHYLREKGIVV